MTLKKDTPKRKVGRPSLRTLKIKPLPKDSSKSYYRAYGNRGICAIYGIDNFVLELIEYLWKIDNDFVVCLTDPNTDRLDNLNKLMVNRSNSLHRWNRMSLDGFLEEPVTDVIIVTPEYFEEVKSKQSKKSVFKYIVLQEDF